MSRAPVYLAEIETRNFSFLALGTTETEARAALCSTFIVHLEQRGIKPTEGAERWAEISEDVCTFALVPGGLGAVDREPLTARPKPVPTYYVEKGRVTCPDVAEQWGVPLGADEYQFGDGPAGARSTSFDFPTLEAGFIALAPAQFILEGVEGLNPPAESDLPAEIRDRLARRFPYALPLFEAMEARAKSDSVYESLFAQWVAVGGTVLLRDNLARPFENADFIQSQKADHFDPFLDCWAAIDTAGFHARIGYDEESGE